MANLQRYGTSEDADENHVFAEDEQEQAKAVASPRLAFLRKSLAPRNRSARSLSQSSTTDVLRRQNANCFDEDVAKNLQDDEEQWFFNLEEVIDDQVQVQEDEEQQQQQQEVPSPTPSTSSTRKSIVGAKPSLFRKQSSSGKGSHLNLTRLFRTGSKDSNAASDSEEDPKSPVTRRRDMNSPTASLFSSASSANSPRISSPLSSPFVGRGRKTVPKTETPLKPEAELARLRSMQELDSCIQDKGMRSGLIEGLASTKEDILLKIQFIIAVNDWVANSEDKNGQDEVNELKASKIVKRYLSSTSTFRIEGIPSMYEEMLVVQCDYSGLAGLKSHVLDQLVKEDAVLRALHLCFSAKGQMSI